DAPRVIVLLDFPELPFPVLGLAIGHPTEHPEQKPRLPQDLMHFTNGYQALTADDARLVAYDQVIHDYYQQRGTHQRDETFSHHIISEMSRDPQQRAGILQALQQQGFLTE
ncbi:NADPH-dependent oxidoreductase, partial [Levilactobacillus brevis]|nr:NADPH-dependent oxidoreductase [Levilactobacillus brevis]